MKCLGITTTRRREKRVGSDRRFHGAPVDGIQGAPEGVGPRPEHRSEIGKPEAVRFGSIPSRDWFKGTTGNHGLKTMKCRGFCSFFRNILLINASIKHPETTCEI